MNRFCIFKNGKAIKSYQREKLARKRFLDVCYRSDVENDSVMLLDLEDDARVISEW